MKHTPGLLNSYSCGCKILQDSAGAAVIQYCPKHAAASQLLAALELVKDWLEASCEYADGTEPYNTVDQAIRKARQ